MNSLIFPILQITVANKFDFSAIGTKMWNVTLLVCSLLQVFIGKFPCQHLSPFFGTIISCHARTVKVSAAAAKNEEKVPTQPETIKLELLS